MPQRVVSRLVGLEAANAVVVEEGIPQRGQEDSSSDSDLAIARAELEVAEARARMLVLKSSRAVQGIANNRAAYGQRTNRYATGQRPTTYERLTATRTTRNA